jgi:hypothetical protein
LAGLASYLRHNWKGAIFRATVRSKRMSEAKQKLIALEKEDLEVISALCQDAVLKVGNLKFLPKEKRFLIELRRFNWEKGEIEPERKLSVLHFERVNRVASRGIDPKSHDQVLSLLALIFQETEAPAGHIDLVFAGDFTIRLVVDCIEAQLSDMDAAWAAQAAPKHPET